MNKSIFILFFLAMSCFDLTSVSSSAEPSSNSSTEEEDSITISGLTFYTDGTAELTFTSTVIDTATILDEEATITLTHGEDICTLTLKVGAALAGDGVAEAEDVEDTRVMHTQFLVLNNQACDTILAEQGDIDSITISEGFFSTGEVSNTETTFEEFALSAALIIEPTGLKFKHNTGGTTIYYTSSSEATPVVLGGTITFDDGVDTCAWTVAANPTPIEDTPIGDVRGVIVTAVTGMCAVEYDNIALTATVSADLFTSGILKNIETEVSELVVTGYTPPGP